MREFVFQLMEGGRERAHSYFLSSSVKTWSFPLALAPTKTFNEGWNLFKDCTELISSKCSKLLTFLPLVLKSSIWKKKKKCRFFTWEGGDWWNWLKSSEHFLLIQHEITKDFTWYLSLSHTHTHWKSSQLTRLGLAMLPQTNRSSRLGCHVARNLVNQRPVWVSCLKDKKNVKRD